MILTSLQIAGFGRLVDRRFDFARGLNVVFGSNESGKSTLANAIVATLYGAERKKEQWRPWTGGAFATTLVYVLADGGRIEIQRDFDRDAKGLRVYDRNGNEISGQLPGQRVVPGEAHLGVPLDVFLNAACVKQQAIAIDEGKPAGPTAAHLARALAGGPREDAALGAIARLDDALRIHIGSERARKNAPLRTLRELAQQQRLSADETRSRLAALDELRDRFERATELRDRLATKAGEIDRRARALRAGEIIKRLANLHEFHAELAELQADRARYADVAAFPAERERDVDEAYYAWDTARQTAATLSTAARAAQLSDVERTELEARRRDAGSIDEPTFARLEAANGRAKVARAAAATAAREAAAARSGSPDPKLRNGWLTAGVLTLCIAVGFAIAHSWTWTGVAAAVALLALATAYSQQRERAERDRHSREKQQVADDALDAELAAANAVAAVLDPLGLEHFDDLLDRRSRHARLLARKREAESSADRGRGARVAADVAGAKFDRLATALLPAFAGERTAHRLAVNAGAARRRERDGIDAHLHALEIRRSTILGGADAYALESELVELQRDGVEPVLAESLALRAIEHERNAVGELLRSATDSQSRLSGEIDGIQTQATDLAELDELFARTQAEIARLEAFERAVTLAKSTLEGRTREAHQAFAHRLEDYAAATLGVITAGRYAEIFVDPATLAIRVRIPETQAIEDLDSVSAGTRDQTYLMVRFAMARMFAEGIESPPLLLDDPFAYWDAVRIERCLPIIETGAHDGQAILLTSSRELADAAMRRGAHRVDLSQPALS